jgi:DNA polymerase elongation subunit (family B)
MENNRLLFGKAERAAHSIVSIEVKDDIATLFQQDDDGSVYKTLTSNKFWLLTDNKNSGWTQLKGKNHYQYGKQFDSREEWEQKRRQLKKSNDIYSIYDPKESFQILKGYTYYRGLKPKDISILSFDIETTGLLFNKDSKVLLISNTFRKNEKLWNEKTQEDVDNFVIEKKLFSYDDFNDEGEMLEAWCEWVRFMDPSIIAGHNINSFDINYLQFIARKFDVKLKLGRDGSELKTNHYESKFRKDGSQDLHYRKHAIYGREIIDTMFLSIKHDIAVKKYPSYGLKSIIAVERLESANRTFYDASKIRFNYQNPSEWTKIKEYCKDDSDDALKLFDLMIPAQFYSAQMVPKPMQAIVEGATGSQINSMMVRSYLQEGWAIPKANEVSHFEGAISIGIPGIHKNVLSFDVASLYPSIMLEYKVNDLFKDPNNNFLKILEILTNERLKNKKLAKETGNQYYKDLEQSQKIYINSCYGFKGAPGLNFNDLPGADFVTRKGREILQAAIKWATNKEFDEWKEGNLNEV